MNMTVVNVHWATHIELSTHWTYRIQWMQTIEEMTNNARNTSKSYNTQSLRLILEMNKFYSTGKAYTSYCGLLHTSFIKLVTGIEYVAMANVKLKIQFHRIAWKWQGKMINLPVAGHFCHFLGCVSCEYLWCNMDNIDGGEWGAFCYAISHIGYDMGHKCFMVDTYELFIKCVQTNEIHLISFILCA